MIASELGVKCDSVWKMITKDLGIRSSRRPNMEAINSVVTTELRRIPGESFQMCKEGVVEKDGKVL